MGKGDFNYKLMKALVQREVRKQLELKDQLSIKELLSKSEAAEIFGVSTRTIDRWREEGLLNACKNGAGKKVLFTRKEVYRTLKNLSHGRSF